MRRPRPAKPAAPRRTVPWRAAAITLAVALTYANSLSNAFVLDDQASVVQNPTIRDLSRLSTVFDPVPDSPVAGRPLVNLSLAIDYAIGGLDPRGYHVTNIGLHILCALLAFGLVRLTLELPRVHARVPGRPEDLAFAAVVIWAVHPLNSEVIDYVSQRTESMMAALLLLTVYASARAALSGSKAWQGTAVVSCALGALCKESIATAPLLVVLYDRVFLFESWRSLARRRSPLYLGLAASWVVVGALLASSPRASVAGPGSGVPVWTYLLNQAAMIVEYLRLSVWPRALVAFYGWPEPLTLGDVLPQMLIVLALLLATLVGLVRVPQVGFLGAWFFITLAPASSVIPISTEVGAERRMYLPLLALLVAVVIVGAAVLRRLAGAAGPAGPAEAGHYGRVDAIAAGALAVATGALSAAAIDRNREYSSQLVLAETIVERRPTGVAHHMLGEQLLQAGRTGEALTQLREAVSQGNSRANFPLGLTLFQQGEVTEARERLEAFVATEGVRHVPIWLDPPVDEVLRARTVIGLVRLREADWQRAHEQADRVLAAAPRWPDGRALRAHAFFGEQRWTDAAREYREYLTARPRDVRALLNYGISLVATGRLDEAVSVFRLATTVDPSNDEAKRLLGLAEQDRVRLGQQ